ncbi:MAG: amidase [Myxococcaceae bacterium]|nr:amidase [Myxococcaceae bacterium]
MIAQDEYTKLDGTALAELVRRREVSASELLEVAIARAEALQPGLNAIVTPMHELARARAASEPAGPLAGVPFLLKDLDQHYQGVPSASGSLALKRARWTPSEHSEITRRWLAAGVVPFGMTNTPEFGAKGVTEPLAWGPARNPWQPERTPGGSSGGSAAAVAARIVPLAGANDGGGSIRIPASYSGLFGLKPGRGRTPTGPERGELLHGAAVNHVLTRSVRDSALMLDLTHGPELGSWSKIAPPERPYLEEVTREPGRLRIAFSTRSALERPVDAEAVEAVEQAAHLLESLGHHVERGEPQLDFQRMARDFLRIWFAHIAEHVESARKLPGARWNDFEPDTLAMTALGHATSSVAYVESYLRWNDYARALGEFHAKFDLFMTPTTATPAPRVGEVQTPRWLDQLMRQVFALGLSGAVGRLPGAVDKVALDNLSYVPFTQLANLTGVPAMSVPLHVCQSGLPMGVQFVATHGGEGMLLSLAGQLERARPWSERAPAGL